MVKLVAPRADELEIELIAPATSMQIAHHFNMSYKHWEMKEIIRYINIAYEMNLPIDWGKDQYIISDQSILSHIIQRVRFILWKRWDKRLFIMGNRYVTLVGIDGGKPELDHQFKLRRNIEVGLYGNLGQEFFVVTPYCKGLYCDIVDKFSRDPNVTQIDKGFFTNINYKNVLDFAWSKL